MSYKRIFTVVIDSVGVGNAPDAKDFGDDGANTIKHVTDYFEGNLKIPNLEKLGLNKIYENENILNSSKNVQVIGDYGRMYEQSVGKDSMDGHWEMMGLPVMKHLSFFPNGFPEDIINKIEEFSGRKVIVNKPYSGTEVINDYGEQQLEDGSLIVYTSGDSVLQIAAHEEIIPLNELYKISEYVRSLVNGPEYVIGRVISRPYIGNKKENFKRTDNRRDFSLLPDRNTVLNTLTDKGIEVVGVGKISDIFSGIGIKRMFHNKSNEQGMDHIDNLIQEDFSGFVFANLVDFDSLYGHRRNPQGFGEELEAFDKRLGKVLSDLKKDDLLIITADHGNDPTFKGSDHTRESVPLLVYSKSMLKPDQYLGNRNTFQDLGATILENFSIENNTGGTSFYSEIKN